jgi:hypothetical protein
MPTVIRRHPILTRAVILVGIAVVFIAAIVWTMLVEHVPQGRPYVEVVTTRCVRPDGEPIGQEFGQPCPSGTTPDAVVIQSLLP